MLFPSLTCSARGRAKGGSSSCTGPTEWQWREAVMINRRNTVTEKAAAFVIVLTTVSFLPFVRFSLEFLPGGSEL